MSDISHTYKQEEADNQRIDFVILYEGDKLTSPQQVIKTSCPTNKEDYDVLWAYYDMLKKNNPNTTFHMMELKFNVEI